MINVNGKAFELTDGATLHDWLVNNQIDPAKVAVELNGDIIKRAEYAATTLKDDDTLEVVTFMGGG